MSEEKLYEQFPENTAEITPMMRQYMDVKRQYMDCLLMYRLGDFYEMFFQDAKTASAELDLTLTGRQCGLKLRAAMCGVPYHSVDVYVARLIARGYKVAICDQTEDPATAKGLVDRGVTRVVTPGTVTDASMLEGDANNYLCAICADEHGAGMSFCDISTGQALVTELLADFTDQAIEECGLYNPREVLLSYGASNDRFLTALRQRGCLTERCDARFDPDTAADRVRAQFSDAPALQEVLASRYAARALAALLSYLAETQMTTLGNLRTLERYSRAQYMMLDEVARRNLELFQTLRGHEKKGSLWWVLAHTATTMGARTLRRWMEQPLMQPAAIGRRLNAVEVLVEEPAVRRAIAEELSGIQDLERLISRAALGTANARDLQSIGASVARVPEIKRQLGMLDCELLRSLYGELDELTDIASLIDAAIADNPPVTLRDGGLIRRGDDHEVDKLRVLVDDSRALLSSIEQRERERTGIKTLKIGYNKVFGYYLEVSRAAAAQVPEDYIRKQTLVNGERYITPELKDLETQVLSAKDRITGLEYEVFERVRKTVAEATPRIQQTAAALAQLDVLQNFAELAVKNDYRRPTVDAGDALVITDGRHPVIEQILGKRAFIANDTRLDCGEHRMAIITGPNMAGKSTYMRQTALIVLMAQLGSFVPAGTARIGVCDRIFTRIGASDDLSAGQSTFMVEMSEVAEIIRSATSRSLLILDEIGRGTSTYDGMSIARAVLEYVADKKKLGARTMFATHYHELTELSEILEGVKNYATAVKKRGDDITFLRRIVPGGADDSYGIEVAKLAGVPEPVIRRAKEILKSLESGGTVRVTGRKRPETPQVSLTDFGAVELVSRIRRLNLDEMSPMQALNLLYELKTTAERLP